ncbi:hypothetical protein N752_00165 [Desulforamulus aquiferis]|nr:carboxypeptidase regulatory-like domain-containing protein [Desulforamulus aquiferis]RYD07028.1 hypothetical protein N752_00165 [Desulforamulus aquiferis]
MAKKQAVTSAVEGTVTFEGKNVANAAIKVFAAGSIEVVKEAQTDANGSFKLSLPEGKYDLTASNEEAVAFQGSVTLNQNQVISIKLEMVQAAILTGTLVDAKGNTVKNAMLTFTTNPTFMTKTGATGKYTISVLPNHTYTVRVYDPEAADQEPEILTSSLEVGAAGKHSIPTFNAKFTVSATSGGGGGGGSVTPPGPIVIDKEVTTGAPVSLGTLTGAVKVNANVTLPSGQTIPLVLDFAANGEAVSLTVTEVADNIKPTDGPFLGLDITLAGMEGKEVSITLPLPANLLAADAAAYHYNNGEQVWDYREATIDGNKITFKTTLSPVAVSKKVAAPKLSAANVNKSSVDLSWTSVVDAYTYKLYRDGSKLVGTTPNLLLTDTGLAAGYKYSYQVVTINKNKFSSKKSDKVTITTAPVAIPANNLFAILDAIEEALANISQEDWEKLREYKDTLKLRTDEEILQALKDTGLAKAFENVINSNITESQMRISIAAIRVLADIGKDNVVESRAQISSKINELKQAFRTELDRLISQGINQQAVYDYITDLYDNILVGKYLVRESNYEADLFDAALKELRNGKHDAIKDAAETAFETLKTQYSTPRDTDSDFKKLIRQIIAEKEFATLTGNDLRLVKSYLVSELTDDQEKFKTIISLMELTIETSKIFIPLN